MPPPVLPLFSSIASLLHIPLNQPPPPRCKRRFWMIPILPDLFAAEEPCEVGGGEGVREGAGHVEDVAHAVRRLEPLHPWPRRRLDCKKERGQSSMISACLLQYAKTKVLNPRSLPSYIFSVGQPTSTIQSEFFICGIRALQR